MVAALAFAAVGGLVYAHPGGVHARTESGSVSSSLEGPRTCPPSWLLTHYPFSR